jgi:predicted PurR-regulated permease PerM
MVILPVALFGFFIYIELVHLIGRLQGDNFEFLQETLAALREALETDFFARLGITESLLMQRAAEEARGFIDYLLRHLRGITENTLVFMAKFVVMLYCLFFFFRDGRKFMDRLRAVSPLGGEIDAFLIQKLASTLRVVLKTMIVIGGLQGFLGGLVFFAVGMQGAVIWGVVMMFASLLPAVGTSVIVVPVGAAMLLGGYIWEGLVIFAAGFFLIGTVDNFLRPVLIGREAEIHPLLIFLSSLGGIVIFGFSGLLLGPLGASLFIATWQIFFKLNQAKVPVAPD